MQILQKQDFTWEKTQLAYSQGHRGGQSALTARFPVT